MWAHHGWGFYNVGLYSVVIFLVVTDFNAMLHSLSFFIMQNMNMTVAPNLYLHYDRSNRPYQQSQI
jgi:uncharacterized membrane protein YhiD involved in acid resistance